MNLDEPLFPERLWYTMGEREDCVATLLGWAKGAQFHRYGRTAIEDYFDADARDWTTEEYRDWSDATKSSPPLVEFSSSISYYGSLAWWLVFRRVGSGDRGSCGNHSTPGDAAYVALHLIELEERDAFVARTVIGVA